MGACKSKGQPRDLGDDGGDEVAFVDDPVRELYGLFKSDFGLDNSEVLLLAAMVKARRLDKLKAEAQSLVVQREAMEQNCPRDFLIQRISEASPNGNDVVISYRKFEAVITDCFEGTDVQTAIDQMRILQTERQIQRYGTASVRVGRLPETLSAPRESAREWERESARELAREAMEPRTASRAAMPAPPLARLYTATEPDTSEEPTDEVPA